MQVTLNTYRMYKYVGWLVLICNPWIVSVGLAQQETQSLEHSEQLRTMDKGVEFMSQGEFVKADILFLRVLEQVKTVPADLCFYFGKNSYHLQKYKQSIDWLNKYMELKGTTGRFFDQAVEYLQLAEADYASASEKKSAVTEAKPQLKSRTLDCSETPYVRCPVCNGDGVVIEAGKLGTAVYKTCPYSDESGRMRCEDYQKYLQGKLKASGAK